jgi:NAD(P)-dependent dehydrogenase (short-subunit alcohol dehydrogenase family)
MSLRAQSSSRSLAIVTGGSAGIGCDLARPCAWDGFDFIIDADEPLAAAAAVFSTRRSAAEQHRTMAEPGSGGQK